MEKTSNSLMVGTGEMMMTFSEDQSVASDMFALTYVSVCLSAGIQCSHQLAEVPEDSRSRHTAGGDSRGGTGGDEGPG